MKYLVILFLFCGKGWAIAPDQKLLPIGLAPSETVPRTAVRSTEAPLGPIHSLGEWESSDSVMTLWPNPSLIRALSDHGNVTLIADGAKEEAWWKRWISNNGISPSNISYLQIPTNSLWIRDYGPWFIVDRKGAFGMVDTTYNRPRPLDDVVPVALSRKLSIPLYDLGLVHTGGNYYSDGSVSAFSSSLVYRENSGISVKAIANLMLSFLGIQNYVTGDLGKHITIEHLDTFGKLVAPDTWVVGDFPQNTSFAKDMKRWVSQLEGQISPYGTPYKIYKMPMTRLSGKRNYRAYLNSFMSNGALFFPSYGNDSTDEAAKAIYQKALPAYKIVGVDALGTKWGDSVHCRTRNLHQRDAIYLFPNIIKRIDSIEITLQAFPSPSARLSGRPLLIWALNGKEQPPKTLDWIEGHTYGTEIESLKAGSRVAFHIHAGDDSGKMKTLPRYAPKEKIRIEF